MICTSILAKTVEAMLVQVREAKKQGADLVELRPTWEGGQYNGDEGMRQSALHKAMELGADYVDVEFKVADEFFKSINDDEKELNKTNIIVSSHNFVNTPSLEEFGGLMASIQAVGADIVKIATTAVYITDNARIMQLLAYSQVPMIRVVMGEKGLNVKDTQREIWWIPYICNP
uniref:3-dehydroquinate dehydratase n=1 Tax=Chenopodium quinoa TaxID=63459 RepID=A0A803KPF9_CHEQI